MRHWKLFGVLAALTLVASACGNDADDVAAEDDGPTLEITSPADGAEVGSTFILEVSSSEELGPTETGAHHIHVWYDGDESTYDVVESDSFEVTGLSPGEREITASLRFANHSAAGAEHTITVTVTGEPGTEEVEEEDDIGY
jgi:hypothetical protein